MRFPLSFTVRKRRPEAHRNTKALAFLALTLAWMVAICGTTPLLAQSPSFPDFSSVDNLIFNPGPPNGPAQVGNVLRLTPALPSRVGSAWFGTLQPVDNGFSTTFSFKLTNQSTPQADGIDFVIQSSQAGTAALGQAGGYLGYGGTIGGDPDIPGIDNSLAIEFDTYANEWDVNIPGVQPANHVAVQSCAHAANTVNHMQCNHGIASAPAGITLSDGEAHVVRIEYTGTPAICIECSTPTLQVFIDDLPVFDAPLQVDLSQYISFLGENEDSAYVGLTGATGASYENHDILSWIFTSHGGQTITQTNLPANEFTTYNFGSYLYKVKPDQNIQSLAVKEVPTDFDTFAADRNAIGDFPNAKCTVYDHTGGHCIEFHALCSGATCNNVNYDVVTSYDVPPGPPNTSPGFLKATGKDCAPGIRFDQNIITEYLQTRTDPTTKGSSKPTFSCFVAVQNVNYLPADLDILNLASPKVKPNTNLTYVATVTDFGPSSAQGVVIKNTIPSGTTYVSSGLCTLSGGCSATPCTFDGTAVRCSVGNLAKFGLQFMAVTVKVTAPAGTIIRDTATVDAFNPDPDVKPDRSSTMVTTVSNR
jgi:uncharacterized repeat protein (TIGR01451 family)